MQSRNTAELRDVFSSLLRVFDMAAACAGILFFLRTPKAAAAGSRSGTLCRSRFAVLSYFANSFFFH
jgi:hypothetical protein